MASTSMHAICSRDASSLFLYFLFNLTLTYLNKIILQKIKLPYLLTALHALSTWLGCAVLLRRKRQRECLHSQKTELGQKDHVRLFLFSLLYCLNIAVSNVSLHLTPLAVHQLLRATTPAITALLLRFCTSKAHYTPAAYAALTLIVLGVVLATGVGAAPAKQAPIRQFFRKDTSTNGDVTWATFSSPGGVASVLLTLFGALLASFKSIMAAQLQQRKPRSAQTSLERGISLEAKLNSLELIHRISIPAFLQALLYAWGAGELGQLLRLRRFLPSDPLTSSVFKSSVGREDLVTHAQCSLFTLFGLLVLNGLTALALNIASFEANRRVGALGITIAGNVKQVLLIVCGMMSGLHGETGASGAKQLWCRWIGVGTTVGGSAWWVLEERRRRITERVKDEEAETRLKSAEVDGRLELGLRRED